MKQRQLTAVGETLYSQSLSPARLSHLNFPQTHHQLGTKCKDYGDISHANPTPLSPRSHCRCLPLISNVCLFLALTDGCNQVAHLVVSGSVQDCPQETPAVLSYLNPIHTCQHDWTSLPTRINTAQHNEALLK